MFEADHWCLRQSSGVCGSVVVFEAEQWCLRQSSCSFEADPWCLSVPVTVHVPVR